MCEEGVNDAKKPGVPTTCVGCALEKQLRASAPSGMYGCSTATTKTTTTSILFLKDISMVCPIKLQ